MDFLFTQLKEEEFPEPYDDRLLKLIGFLNVRIIIIITASYMHECRYNSPRLAAVLLLDGTLVLGARELPVWAGHDTIITICTTDTLSVHRHIMIHLWKKIRGEPATKRESPVF